MDEEKKLLESGKKPSKAKVILGSALRIGRKALRATILTAVIAAPILTIANYWGKWLYQVKTNYGVVVTEWDGDRIAMDKEGWYLRTPLLSTYEEEYPMANQESFLHGKTKPHEVIAKDGVVILAAATTFYEIADLNQYAIENVKAEVTTIDLIDKSFRSNTTILISPRDMIQRTLDSIIGDHIQKTDYHKLIHNRSEVEKEINEALKNSELSQQYGIKINSFRLTETRYIDSVIKANAERQASVAHAEGDFDAAVIEKKTIKTRGKAYTEMFDGLEKEVEPKTAEQRIRLLDFYIKYQTLKERSGDTVWMLDGESPTPVYKP